MFANSEDNRQAFSARLKGALQEAGMSPDSPTQLCRIFNDVYEGRPITVHAARKWLVGEAIPTHEKLAVMAGILQVAPNYLMWGDESEVTLPALESADMRLLLKIRALSDEDQELVSAMVNLLTRRRQKGDFGPMKEAA